MRRRTREGTQQWEQPGQKPQSYREQVLSVNTRQTDQRGSQQKCWHHSIATTCRMTSCRLPDLSRVTSFTCGMEGFLPEELWWRLRDLKADNSA